MSVPTSDATASCLDFNFLRSGREGGRRVYKLYMHNIHSVLHAHTSNQTCGLIKDFFRTTSKTP